jgi:hypothetical protein
MVKVELRKRSGNFGKGGQRKARKARKPRKGKDRKGMKDIEIWEVQQGSNPCTGDAQIVQTSTYVPLGRWSKYSRQNTREGGRRKEEKES